jgi:predicted GNAT superfamily acetyltransferase
MIWFVYSLPGIKHGKATQWSHMAGVVAEHRSAGLGQTLKLLQRDRTLAMGLDLIEWTYDPLQAMNAHLNFAKLGVIAEEYAENIYGTSSSPLHQGNPTDRFVAEWWIRTPHVERRLAPPARSRCGRAVWATPRRSTGPRDRASGWSRSTSISPSRRAGSSWKFRWGSPRCWRARPSSALAWRICTRAIFTTYFDRGYRAVDFILDREGARALTCLRAIKNFRSLQPEGEPFRRAVNAR